MAINKQAIRQSLEDIKPRAEEFANGFYVNLLSDYPEIRILFNRVQIDRQKRLFIAALVQIVNNLDSPEFLADYLEKMGERHSSYGVKPQHFEMVGLSLIKSLGELMGPAFTQDLRHQWAQVYDLVCEHFRAGMVPTGEKKDFLPKDQPALAKNSRQERDEVPSELPTLQDVLVSEEVAPLHDDQNLAAKVLPLRTTISKEWKLELRLPEEVTGQLEIMAAEYVQKALQEYLDAAVADEVERALGKTEVVPARRKAP